MRRSILPLIVAVTVHTFDECGAAVRHRYSFSEGATADATGRVIVDSIGGADGIVKGAGASAIETELILPGGSSGTQAYVDLPNGIISSLTDATFEVWYTIDSVRYWARVFEFGVMTPTDGVMGELTGPGGSGTAWEEVHFAAQVRDEIARQRFSFSTFLDGSIDFYSEYPQVLGQKYHAAMVIDADGAGPGTATMALYINGALAPGDGSTPNPVPILRQLADINDVNNWLGRSQWTGDENFGGRYDEFRIYDEALTGEQVAQSFANGPDNLFVPEPATISLLVVAAGCGMRSLRRYKEKKEISRQRVQSAATQRVA